MKSQFSDAKVTETIAPVSQIIEPTVVEKMVEAFALRNEHYRCGPYYCGWSMDL